MTMMVMKKAFCYAVFYLSVVQTVLGQSSGFEDLPDCARPCLSQALSAANCGNNDVACFCANPAIRTNAQNCADSNNVCPVEDRSATNQVLREVCANQPPASSSSPFSSSSSSSASSSSSGSSSASQTSSQSSTTSGSTSLSTTHSSTHSATPTPTTTPGPVSRNPSTSLSATTSGTVVVIQTVTLPDPSNLTGGATSLISGIGGPMGGILSFGLCIVGGTALLLL
jgi:hypothetical protein